VPVSPYWCCVNLYNHGVNVPIILCLQIDESLSERLWALTEMFPDGMRNASGLAADCSVSLVKKIYRYVAEPFIQGRHGVSDCAEVIF